MKKYTYFIFLTAILLVSLKTYAQDSLAKQTYTFKKGDPNGIGKWYMGREIAYVMGFQGIDWLERSEREEEEKTTKLLNNMNISSTDVIADIGAGSGYHTFQMGLMASKGVIYAVDIQPEMLVTMEYRKASENIKNVETIQGSEYSVNLPENSIDKVLMVDVYHEFNYPSEMLASIKKALKPNGKIFLIEYRGEDDNVPIKRLHKMTENQAVKEFEAANFILEKNVDNLPWQHCMIFTKRKY